MYVAKNNSYLDMQCTRAGYTNRAGDIQPHLPAMILLSWIQRVVTIIFSHNYISENQFWFYAWKINKGSYIFIETINGNVQEEERFGYCFYWFKKDLR